MLPLPLEFRGRIRSGTSATPPLAGGVVLPGQEVPVYCLGAGADPVLELSLRGFGFSKPSFVHTSGKPRDHRDILLLRDVDGEEDGRGTRGHDSGLTLGMQTEAGGGFDADEAGLSWRAINKSNARRDGRGDGPGRLRVGISVLCWVLNHTGLPLSFGQGHGT